VRLKLFAILIVFCLVPQAFAGENLFNSSLEIKKEVFSLRDEALDILRTPLDTEHGGFIGTVIVAGGTALTYVFDDDIRNQIRKLSSQTLDKAMDVGYSLGNPLIHIGLAGAVYGGGILAGSKKWEENGKMLGEAALLADASTLVLKESFGRGRPYVTDDKGSFKPFQFNSGYDSLPSMHVASSFAIASVMSSTSESPAAKAAYYLAATFVGFSRMYEDDHWASDVVLGAAIGELCGRVVLRYHSTGKRKVVFAPIISGNAVSLALSASW